MNNYALSDRTFPRLKTQWRITRSVTLTHRCGGSAGFNFTHRLPVSPEAFAGGHLTRRNYSAAEGIVLAFSLLLLRNAVSTWSRNDESDKHA